MTNVRGQNFNPENQKIEILGKYVNEAALATKKSYSEIGAAFSNAGKSILEKHLKEGDK
jgi:hypothetical protein